MSQCGRICVITKETNSSLCGDEKAFMNCSDEPWPQFYNLLI